MSQYHPKAQPSSRLLALLVSVGACAVAVAAARELWTKRTGTELKSWLRPVFEFIARAHYEAWMLPAGMLAALIGLFFIFAAIKPRTGTHVALASASNHWIRNVDIARLCTATAERVPGVATASTYASPRHVVVTITGTDSDPMLVDRVTEAVRPLVDQLAVSRRVSVKFHARRGERP